MDKLEEYHVFTSLVELGSFTKVAISLSMSQPSVSRIIRDLESRLAVTLFHRSTRQVSVTEEGQQFYKVAKEILETIEDCFVHNK